jgi:apolipoprotein N-acyltransferase
LLKFVAQDRKIDYYKKIVLCLLAGVSLPLAFAPYNLILIGFISPAILFYLWYNMGPGASFTMGYVYGLGMFGTGVNWLHISINLFGGVNLTGAFFLTYLLVAFLALYPALVGFICSKYRNNNHNLSLLVMMPAVWTFAEWCRSWIFTGFPWLNLGYTQTDTHFSGFAPLFGVYAVTFIVCIIAALIVSLFKLPKKLKVVAVIATVLIWVSAVAVHDIQWVTPEPEQRSVALIQAAIPQDQKWKPELQQHTINLYMSLSEPFWGKDLIIWPETAIPMFYHQAGEVIDLLHDKTAAYNTDVLSGIPVSDQSSSKYYNSIIVIGSNKDIFNKRHLVPFGEYLPLDRWLRPLLKILQIPISRFSPGDGRPLVHAAGIPIGVSICYEDVFGEEVIDAFPDAKLLVNTSNDAWFGDSLAPHQHLQMARMRAIETGRYLLRATNTGISAIIDEKGNIISSSRQFMPDAISESVRLFNGMTPYARLGNIPVVLFVILLCFIIILFNHRKEIIV